MPGASNPVGGAAAVRPDLIPPSKRGKCGSSKKYLLLGYLAGFIVLHLLVVLLLFYGLYVLHPLCFVAFVVGTLLWALRGGVTPKPYKSNWTIPNAASWQQTGDRLADLVVESGLFKPNEIKYENILRLLAEKEAAQKHQQDDHADGRSIIYREIIDELERVPSWVNLDLIEHGRQVYRSNILALSAALPIALVDAYAFPVDAQVLFISGGLTASKKAIVRRLMETGFWVFTLMKEGLRVGSKGHAACVNVRLIHAMARRLCLSSPVWQQSKPALSEFDGDGKPLSEEELRAQIDKNGFYGLAMKFLRSQQPAANNEERKSPTDGGSKYNHVEGEIPINQATLLGTLFLFCHDCIEVAQMRGIKFSDKDKQAYWHLWRYIGYLTGVDERLMPERYEDGLQAKLSAIYNERKRPDYTSKVLTRTTVDALVKLPYMPINRQLFNVSVRYFLGDEMCDKLGIDPVNITHVAKWWLTKYTFALLNILNTLLPPLKQVQNLFFWHYMDQAFKEYFTLNFPPASLDPSKSQAPGAASACPFLSSTSSSRPRTSSCPFGQR